MRLGVVAYSFKEAAVDAYGLIDRAAAAGLELVEFSPQSALSATTDSDLAHVRAYAEEREVSIIASGGLVQVNDLRRWIAQASVLGSPVLRVVLSPINSGNRRAMAGAWRTHLEATRDVLRAMRPAAEGHDIVVAIENHQDVTSDELLWLCEEVGGDHIGVTLDPGNALAVAEDPVAFAHRLKDFVRNVHLKDYRVYLSPNGYRLTRCAVGTGVVDFPAIFALFGCLPDLPVGIEMGVTFPRHIQFLEDEWWSDYPPRRAQDLLGVLRTAFRGARPPDEDWRTPHEREEPVERRVEYELRQFAESVNYLRRVVGLCRSASRA